MKAEHNQKIHPQGLKSGDQPDSTDEPYPASDQAARDSEHSFVQGGPGATERDNQRRVIDGVNTEVVAGSIENITNHSRQGHFKGKLCVSRVCEGVGDKK